MQKFFLSALFSLALVGAGCSKAEIKIDDTAKENVPSVSQTETEQPAKAELPKESATPTKDDSVKVEEKVKVVVPAPVAPAVTVAPVVSSAPVTKTIKVTAKKWSFEPSTVTVNKGDRVKLVITSIDVAHGFSLPDFNVKARLEPNTATTVEFTADKVGSFGFFCSVQCGDGHASMQGKLEVK